MVVFWLHNPKVPRTNPGLTIISLSEDVRLMKMFLKPLILKLITNTYTSLYCIVMWLDLVNQPNTYSLVQTTVSSLLEQICALAFANSPS